MIERFPYKNIVWIDVLHPTAEDVKTLFKECRFPAFFAEDLTSMTPRSDTLFSKEAIKTTLDFPVVKRTDIRRPHEIKFLANQKYLVTIRFDDIEVINRFTKELEVLSLLNPKSEKVSGGDLFLVLLNYIYDGLDSKLDFLESTLQNVEEKLFDDDEKKTLFEVSLISRRLISFRHTIAAHENALLDLKNGISEVFPGANDAEIDKLGVTYSHVVRRVNALSNAVDELRNTNNAILNAKQNEVMKILTIMAFITFPLSLFASLFGMNTAHTPLVEGEYGFWNIIGIMTFISICFFAYFKYKRWI